MTEPATNYQALAADYARHRRVHPGVVDALVEAVRADPAPTCSKLAAVPATTSKSCAD
ncbi:MAG: hypothetical protein R2843_02265 [Thermomicrobiales bacterium]